MCGQVKRQVLEAMAGQEDAARERDRFALELEAARGELSAMEAGVREQRDAMERLAGDVRSALERAEGAELERAGLAMRLGGLEDALVTECEVVREGLKGMEGVCVGLEQAMLAVEAECGQVSTLRRAGALEGQRFLTQTWQHLCPGISYTKLGYTILSQDNSVYPKQKFVLQENQGYP